MTTLSITANGADTGMEVLASATTTVIDDAIATALADYSTTAEADLLYQPIFVDAPAAADSTGTAGQVAVDTGYIYVCTATDTWKRVAIATWP